MTSWSSAAGSFPDNDVAALQQIGVDKVFTPGTSLDEAVSYVKERFGAKAGASGAPHHEP